MPSRTLPALILVVACLCTTPAAARVFDFPAPGDAGHVVIYGTTDIEATAPVIDGFQALYPGIAVTYHELNSLEVYERTLAEHAAGDVRADLLLSSAMDLQLKLVNDGYARSYMAPAVGWLPRWAVWRNEAFGFTFEPAVIVYNRDGVPREDVPATRADLLRLIESEPAAYAGRVATYDPQRSGLGFLFATQDAQRSREFWRLVKGLGATGVKLYSSTAAILDRIADGRFLLGYNLLGSYALARSARDASLGVVLPRDYTLAMSRIAMLTRGSPDPWAAERFLDFLLSEAGQRIIAERASLYSLHPAVHGEATAAALRERAGDSLIPIRVGPGLLVNLDQVKREKFLRTWERALGGRIDDGAQRPAADHSDPETGASPVSSPRARSATTLHGGVPR